MITKDALKDWLAESERREYEKELEEFIDKEIKRNALSGKLTFFIPTGKYTTDGSRKTTFYPVWFTEKLSEENRRIVHDKVIQKYKDFGFDVKRTYVDCGWSNNYFALQFSDIDKALEKE